MLPWTMRWMRWHKTQRSKNTPSSLQVNVPDSIWLPFSGKGVLPGSTGPVARHLGPHLDIMGSIRPELERRRAAAFRTWTRFCGFVQASHCVFGAFFFQALVVSILYTGLESLRLRPPNYEYLDRFMLGLGRKMMRGKATITTKLKDGTEKKRTDDRRKVWDFLGLVPSATELHAPSLSMVPESHEGSYGQPERLVFLLCRSFF